MPVRPNNPKDKAKAEVGVQLVDRWIMMRLRHHTFPLTGRVKSMYLGATQTDSTSSL